MGWSILAETNEACTLSVELMNDPLRTIPPGPYTIAKQCSLVRLLRMNQPRPPLLRLGRHAAARLSATIAPPHHAVDEPDRLGLVSAAHAQLADGVIVLHVGCAVLHPRRAAVVATEMRRVEALLPDEQACALDRPAARRRRADGAAKGRGRPASARGSGAVWRGGTHLS